MACWVDKILFPLADDVLLSTAAAAIEGCVLFLAVSVLASGAVGELWDVANTMSKETSASCTSCHSHACVASPVLLAIEDAIPVGLNHRDRRHAICLVYHAARGRQGTFSHEEKEKTRCFCFRRLQQSADCSRS